jgi:tRNA(Ile)-lysidine synthase
VRRGFEPFSVDLHDISFEHVEAVLSLLNKKSGSVVQLPHSLRAVREFDTLVFCRYAENKSFNSEIYPEKEVFAEDYSLKFLLTANKKPSGYTDEIKFDYEKITSIVSNGKLVIRNRADGDKIYLSGVGGRKSVKKILSELKMPLKERNEIIMLANANDVLWINGLKTSGLYKADENTNKIMYLYVMNSEA